MKKSWFTLLALLVVMSLVLGACGATEEPAVEPTEAPAGQATQAPAEEPTQAPSGPVGVPLTIWHQWSGDYLTAIEEAINQCAADQGVTIDMSKPEDTSNALSVAIPAGEGPDIIGWAND
ncbi:MAG: ABC transporter substrate-binding protein, partial [Anaerolineae bacterium]|nr:ABC transporter substrate-binding protein [Anaerolineae bacterium]